MRKYSFHSQNTLIKYCLFDYDIKKTQLSIIQFDLDNLQILLNVINVQNPEQQTLVIKPANKDIPEITFVVVNVIYYKQRISFIFIMILIEGNDFSWYLVYLQVQPVEYQFSGWFECITVDLEV